MPMIIVLQAMAAKIPIPRQVLFLENKTISAMAVGTHIPTKTKKKRIFPSDWGRQWKTGSSLRDRIGQWWNGVSSGNPVM
jgi:hypothetical protein